MRLFGKIKHSIFKWFLFEDDAKSNVNIVPTNARIYTCSFTHLEGGRGNVKECGLHFGYS